MSFPIKIIILRGLFGTHFGAKISSGPVQPGFFLSDVLPILNCNGCVESQSQFAQYYLKT